MKKIIFVLILLISTLSFSEIVVDFFGVDTCLNCAEVKTFLEMVQFEVDNEKIFEPDLKALTDFIDKINF